MPLDPRDFPDQSGGAVPGIDPSSFPDQPSPTPETDAALAETDRLGVSGGPAQGILGRWLGLRDPMVGPEGKIKPEVEEAAAAYQKQIQDRGFSPLVGDVAEAGYRLNPFTGLPMSIAAQAFPVGHPVRQLAEGTSAAVRGTARALSEEDNLALMTATAGLGGLGSRAFSGLFAGQIMSEMPEQWKAFQEAPDLKTKTAMAFQLLGSVGLAGIAGKHFLKGEGVKPPLEPDATIPSSQAGQMELINRGLARGDITREQYDEMAAKIQGKAPQAEEPSVQETPTGEAGVVSETARVAPEEEAVPESEQDAQNRLADLKDRFAIYGIREKPILDAAEQEKGEPLTPSEAADALQEHEDTLNPGSIRRALHTRKTFKQQESEDRVINYAQQRLKEADAQREKRTGVQVSGYFPKMAAVYEPATGGWRIRVGPRKVEVMHPAEKGGKFAPAVPARFEQEIQPEQEWWMSPKGEIRPYANRPYTKTNAVPDVQRKPVKPGTERPTEAGGPREAPPQRPGAQPVAPAERPMAPEAPQAPAGPERYVVEDLFDPKTRKQRGYIVKDRESGDVTRFESTKAHPDANDLLEQREKAKEHIKKLAEKVVEGASESQKPEPVLVTGKKKRFKVGTVVFDEYANSPETPVASAVSEMGGIKSKSAAMDQGKYEGNEALWDTPIKFSHLSHQKIYDPSGEMPDVMAQNLYDRGLIDEPSVESMREALEKESAGIRSKAAAAPEKQAGVKSQVKQAEAFGKGQREEQEGTGGAIPVESLNIGDTVNVDGTDLKVTDVDPDGNVTLEDGKRYGVQQVQDGDVIYGEMGESREATKPVKVAAPSGPVGEAGQKALNTATTNPIAARKAAFSPGAAGHVHKDTGLIIRQNKQKGVWEAINPHTDEVLDTSTTRRNAIDKHLDGLLESRPDAEEAVTPNQDGDFDYDFHSMAGFEKLIEDRFKRKMTDAERKAFEPIIKKVNEAKSDASDAGAEAFTKVLDTMKDVKDISSQEAIDRLQKAISDATKDCG